MAIPQLVSLLKMFCLLQGLLELFLSHTRQQGNCVGHALTKRAKVSFLLLV